MVRFVGGLGSQEQAFVVRSLPTNRFACPGSDVAFLAVHVREYACLYKHLSRFSSASRHARTCICTPSPRCMLSRPPVCCPTLLAQGVDSAVLSPTSHRRISMHPSPSALLRASTGPGSVAAALVRPSARFVRGRTGPAAASFSRGRLLAPVPGIHRGQVTGDDATRTWRRVSGLAEVPVPYICVRACVFVYACAHAPRLTPSSAHAHPGTQVTCASVWLPLQMAGADLIRAGLSWHRVALHSAWGMLLECSGAEPHSETTLVLVASSHGEKVRGD